METLTMAFFPQGSSLGWGFLALPLLFGGVYWGVSFYLVDRRERKRIASQRPWDEDFIESPQLEVVFLRPVKRGVPDLLGKAEALIRSARSGDWVIFGVAGGGEDEATCLAAKKGAKPGVRVEVVPCREANGTGEEPQNPKIAKLLQMTALVERDSGPSHWILSDCEALLEPDFLDRFRAEWSEKRAAYGPVLLTAGYRFQGGDKISQKLDHLSTLLTLWPGLAVAEWGIDLKRDFANAIGASPSTETNASLGLGFTLGACTGITQSDLHLVGGWGTFLKYLAEDNRLGAALEAQGRPTLLSEQILTLESDPPGWRDWIRHQHRVAFTYRVCSPGGFFGMGFTQSLFWSTLLLALNPMASWAWGLFISLALLRVVTARSLARSLQFEIERHPVKFAAYALFVAWAETFFWLAAWFPLPVRWGKHALKVDSKGKFSGPGSKSEKFEQTSLASETGLNYQSDT